MVPILVIASLMRLSVLVGLTILMVAVLIARLRAALALRAILAARIVIVLTLLVAGLLFAGLLLLCFTQHAGVMLGMLQEVLLGHAIISKLGIARQRQIFLDDLLGRATDLAFGTGAVKDPVDDIAHGTLAVRLVTRTGFGRSHGFLFGFMEPYRAHFFRGRPQNGARAAREIFGIGAGKNPAMTP